MLFPCVETGADVELGSVMVRIIKCIAGDIEMYESPIRLLGDVDGAVGQGRVAYRIVTHLHLRRIVSHGVDGTDVKCIIAVRNDIVILVLRVAPAALTPGDAYPVMGQSGAPFVRGSVPRKVDRPVVVEPRFWHYPVASGIPVVRKEKVRGDCGCHGISLGNGGIYSVGRCISERGVHIRNIERDVEPGAVTHVLGRPDDDVEVGSGGIVRNANRRSKGDIEVPDRPIAVPLTHGTNPKVLTVLETTAALILVVYRNSRAVVIGEPCQIRGGIEAGYVAEGYIYVVERIAVTLGIVMCVNAHHANVIAGLVHPPGSIVVGTDNELGAALLAREDNEDKSSQEEQRQVHDPAVEVELLVHRATF